MSANTPNGANKLLGSGAVYFQEVSSAGANLGEKFLGNVKQFEISENVETKESFESVTSNRALVARAIIRARAEIDMTLDEFTAQNIALWMLGDASSQYSQTSQTVTDELVNAGVAVPALDAWYSLAYRQVTVTAVKVGASTKTAGTDYTVDTVGGRIYLPVGSSIVAGTDIVKVSYTAVAMSGASALNQVLGNTKIARTGQVRFVGQPVGGPTYEAIFWKVSFVPDGNMPLITDDYGEFKLKGAVLLDGVHTDPFRLIQRA